MTKFLSFTSVTIWLCTNPMNFRIWSYLLSASVSHFLKQRVQEIEIQKGMHPSNDPSENCFVQQSWKFKFSVLQEWESAITFPQGLELLVCPYSRLRPPSLVFTIDHLDYFRPGWTRVAPIYPAHLMSREMFKRLILPMWRPPFSLFLSTLFQFTKENFLLSSSDPYK